MKASIRLLPLLLIAVASRSLGTQQKHPITFDDFAAVRAVSDPQVSPDGRFVLYSVRTADLTANRRTGKAYVVAVAGSAPRFFPAEDVNASEAR